MSHQRPIHLNTFRNAAFYENAKLFLSVSGFGQNAQKAIFLQKAELFGKIYM